MVLRKALKWLVVGVVVLIGGGMLAISALEQPIGIPGEFATDRPRIHEESLQEPIAQVIEALDGYRTDLVAPSISVAVGVRGKVVLADAIGHADLEAGTPATAETLYAIGSVSKPLTAALVARLWELGKLDIDLDVRAYVPDFPRKQYPFTLRQLLSHQAGIRHYAFKLSLPTFSESDLDREFQSTKEALTLFADDPLLFEPDAGFEYSTFGYTLVAAAVEQVTGLAYEQALAAFVLDPLGMSETSVDDLARIGGTRASDYVRSWSKSAVLPAPSTNSSYKRAGGGLASTPTDLVKFGIAMLGNDLLAAETREVMFTARTLPGGELNPRHYGLGWTIGGLMLKDEASGKERVIPLWHHGGTRAGSVAILMIVPEYEIVVAAAANAVGRGGSGQITGISADIARTFIRWQEGD